MKYHILKKGLFLMIPALFIILTGVIVLASSNGVGEKIKKATQPYDNINGIGTPIPIPINTTKVMTNDGVKPFFTQTRKNEIQRFECNSCHNNKEVRIKNAAGMAHADIKVIHGEKGKPLNCYTCHSKADRNFLTTSKDTKIDMDHVYNMCGECHFRQKKDWIGGAHGKRVTYWAGKRVVSNCTSCHNPHAPRFEKRWPKTYSAPFK